MAAKLILTAEAERDLADAYEWYEARQFGLGEYFTSRVEACLDGLTRSPEMHAIVWGSVRRAPVRRFPYTVFYEYAEDAVTVYGVFHTSRDSASWRERLA